MVATTTETLTVDGVNLKTLAYNVESITSMLQMPPKRGGNTVVANRDGSIWTPYKAYDNAVYPLDMWIRGSDVDGAIPGGSTARKEFWKRVDELTRLFGKDWGTLDVRHTLPDGTVRRALCEVRDSINFAARAVNPLARFVVNLENTEGFWKDVVTQTQASSLINTPWTWNNPTTALGTAPVNDATYTITGPITNPLIRDVTSGCWIKYTGTVGVNQTMVYYADTFIVSGTAGFNADSTKIGYWKTGGRLMRMTPDRLTGLYRVQLEGTGTTAATNLSITGYKKYLVG
jgi:hypothetical protein